MSKLPRIDYYFDVVSPYSYIGFEILHKLENQWKGVSIRYIPFYLGGIIKESGNHPPETVHRKAVMIVADLERTAKFWDIPLKPNHQFMDWMKKYRTTGAMKILLVLDEQEDKELMLRAAREFWLRLWSRSEKIFEDSDFEEVLKAIGVKNVQEVIQKSKEEKYAKILTREWSEWGPRFGYRKPLAYEKWIKCDPHLTPNLVPQSFAISYAAYTHFVTSGLPVLPLGHFATVFTAYGAPWINVLTADGEEHSFFGSDRFHLIADLLQQPRSLSDKLFFNQESKL